jgi:phage terminase large subunit GpA-like protein
MSEVDAYDASAGVEGDPTKLIVKRAGAYDEPKIVRESTPLILEHSRINPAFLSGSEEYFYVPCPHCKEYQQLEWGDEDTNYGIKWEKRATIEESAETVFYVCKPNGCEIEEPSKFAMTQAGEWKAEHPERKEHLSFHLDSLVSPFDGARWAGPGEGAARGGREAGSKESLGQYAARLAVGRGGHRARRVLARDARAPVSVRVRGGQA